MASIGIRPQRLSDAQRFYEILSSQEFKYFPAKPKNVAAERAWMRKQLPKRKARKLLDYAIVLKGKVIGAVGLKIDYHRPHTGEIGYFVDEAHWGKGIATQAVKKIELIAFQKLKLKRLEILMNPRNKASVRVAEKCGYKKEGKLRKAVEEGKGFVDAFIYSKIL